jgi:hypothetical protein
VRLARHVRADIDAGHSSWLRLATMCRDKPAQSGSGRYRNQPVGVLPAADIRLRSEWRVR